MKYLLLLLPFIASSQISGFHDFNTEQFGIQAKGSFTVSDPAEATIGVRHQEYITTIDALIGRKYDLNGAYVKASIGMAQNFTEFVDATGATAIIEVSHPITRTLYLAIHYQPTYNASRFFIDWQHQAGAGLYLSL